jgi:hypothetical protein
MYEKISQSKTAGKIVFDGGAPSPYHSLHGIGCIDSRHKVIHRSKKYEKFRINHIK